jgi:O-antigen ligase
MMRFHQRTGPVTFEQSAHYKLVCLALMLWWAAFIWRAMDMSSISKDRQAVEATEQGSAWNQALVVGFATLGIYHLPRAWRVMQSREGRNLTVLASVYCGWSALSFIWTDDASLTIRRLTQFVLLLVGSYGLGAGFYTRTSGGMRTLARHVLYAGLFAAVLLLPPRLQNLSLSDLLDPAFSIKDNTEIAAITYPVGYALLAGLVLYRWRSVLRWVAAGFFFAVLVFMKGRSMLGDVTASGTILASRLALIPGWRKALMIAGVLQTAFYADLGTGGRLFVTYVASTYDAVYEWLPWITMGAGMKNLTTLSGRLPLWDALYSSIAERPLLGYGFGAFWSPEHLDQILKLSGWHAVVAHSGFLDELLATGLIGLCLLLAFWFYGMALSLRLARKHDYEIGHLVFSWMLLFLLFNTLDSIIQAYLKAPTVFSFVGLFAMMQYYSELEPVNSFEQMPASGVIILEEVRA